MKKLIGLNQLIVLLRHLYIDGEKRNLLDNEPGSHYRLEAICEIADTFQSKLHITHDMYRYEKDSVKQESLSCVISKDVADAIQRSAGLPLIYWVDNVPVETDAVLSILEDLRIAEKDDRSRDALLDVSDSIIAAVKGATAQA